MVTTSYCDYCQIRHNELLLFIMIASWIYLYYKL